MTTPPAAGPAAPGDAITRDMVEAARHGASRALRSDGACDIEDAAADALARLAALGGLPKRIERPAAFAAACGRNAAIDGRRRALRDRALRVRLTAAPRALSTREAMGLPPGWHPQEVRPQARDALAARRMLRRSPSPSLRSAAKALALLLGGAPLPDHGGDADRRRFDRGVARLARLMRGRP
ncbi:hypothetical protein GCM10009416_40510 [Craurococcus roseus]|uniref:Uncharacterized protein n=1 Tax=Craurococcus roseus TaxID=77585 RepID=A0ABN1FUR4_9PROT